MPIQDWSVSTAGLDAIYVAHSEHNLNATIRLKYPGHQSEKIDSGF